jgi:hypothetical protein
MNKKADKIISVYWFAILLIVTAVIVYMVLVFYGQPYNIREVEADILTDKISNCISNGGKLNENWKNLKDNNLLEICNLNFNVEDYKNWKNLEQYYIEINDYKFEINSEKGFGNLIKTVKAGNSELKEDCDKNDESFSFCLERNFYILQNNEEHIIKILSIIKKNEKNII